MRQKLCPQYGVRSIFNTAEYRNSIGIGTLDVLYHTMHDDRIRICILFLIGFNVMT